MIVIVNEIPDKVPTCGNEASWEMIIILVIVKLTILKRVPETACHHVEMKPLGTIIIIIIIIIIIYSFDHK